MDYTTLPFRSETLQPNQSFDFRQYFKVKVCPFVEPTWNVKLYESIFQYPKVFLLEWNEEFSSFFCDLLSERLRFFHQDSVQKQDVQQCILSLLGRLLVFYALKTEYGLQNPKIEWGNNKKPVLLEVPIFFNLSHSANFCACAVSETPVGVDIQYMEDKKILCLAKRFFLPQEYAMLVDCPKNERKRLFYWLWTRKESYLKAKGKGLSFILKDVDYDDKSFLSFGLKEYTLSLCW